MHILLVAETGETRLLNYTGGDIHTKYGIISADDIEPGKEVTTHKGTRYLVLKPTIRDIVQSIRGGAKPIFEYHTGMFAAMLGLQRGSTLLEAGTGSAGATLVFANAIHPGKVISFEREERFYNVAKKNVEISGLDNIILVNDDISNARKYFQTHGLKQVDAIFLDLQDPESLVPQLVDFLKPGGSFGIYTPVFDSVIPVWRAFEDGGFVNIRAIALTLQKVIVKKYARFGQEFFGFPGFFVIGRKFGSVKESGND